MGFEEDLEDLKRIADDVPTKNREQLNFLKSQKKDFKGVYRVLGFNEGDGGGMTGKVSFVPVKVRVMLSVGEPSLYISCNVIFEDFKVNNNSAQSLFDTLKIDVKHKKSLDDFSNVFHNVAKEEFNKLMRLIGMGNFMLDINNIEIK